MNRTEASTIHSDDLSSMANSIVPQINESSVTLSAEILKIHGKSIAFILYRISKYGTTRDYEEKWTIPAGTKPDAIAHRILFSAAALLNKTGKIYYTLDFGLLDKVPLPLGDISFIKISAEDNTTLQIVQATAKAAFIEAYS